MKKLLAVVCAGLFGLACFGAKNYYVDAARPDDSGAGTSWATAFQTIQAAVDAASAGDSINIAEGVYDKGERTNVDSGISSNRVVITKNNLTLVGAGRGKTIIQGKKGTGTYAPLGYDAVRCLLLTNGVTGVTIKNLTLRGGASTASTAEEDSDGRTRRGGGIQCLSDANYLVDCTVEDCTAISSGAAYYTRAVRTLFRNNYVRSGVTGWVNGAISYSASRFLHCVFIGNGGAQLFHGTRDIYNCTFAANAGTINGGSYNGSVTLNNCLVDCDSNPSSDTTGNLKYSVTEVPPTKFTKIENSVTNAAPYSLCAAPALNDCRPLAGSAAIDAASYATLKNLTWGGDYRLVDFDGNKITDPGNDKINAGAYQTSVTPAGGLNLFVARDWNDICVDGIRTRGNKYSDAQTITNYFRTLTYPSQNRYQAICAKPDNELLYIRAYFDGANTRACYLPIDANNACWALAAPAACTNLYYPSKAGISWIDCHSTVGSPDGTEAKPYRSFKEACEARLTGDYAARVFKVKPGTYDSGVSTQTDFKCRVPVRYLTSARFIGVEGSENTIIVGAPDPDSPDGCGTNAVRLCGTTGTKNPACGFMNGFTPLQGN